MKKRHLLISKLAVVLVAVSCCLTMQAVNTITHDATYNFNNMTLGTDTLGGVTYATVNYGDLFNGGAPGAPSLPVDYIRFSVPWNATNFTVSTLLLNSSTQNIHRLVYPCQVPRMMNDTTPVTITLPDSAAYYSNSYYPAQSAWVVDDGFLAGENHIVTIAVMPISFKHSGTGNFTLDMLRTTQTVRLTLNYQLSDSLSMYPIIREDSALRQEGYALTRSMVVNPSSVVSHSPIEMTLDPMGVINPSSGDGLNGGHTPPFIPDDPPIYSDTTNVNMGGEMQIAGYPYLIVTTPELAHSARRIAALKKQKGYNVQVVTMDDVLNSPYSGQGDVVNNKLTYTDDAGKLRQYLRNYYKRFGTDYVLLAGNGVPYRKRYSTVLKDSVPTDFYFCELNADWSIQRDTIDRHPDLFVGRILSKEINQIDNYTDKLFRYELNPGKGDHDYLQRIFYSEGIDFEIKNEWQYVNESYSKIFPTNTRLLETINALFPSGTDVVDSLNTTKYGYISFLNHGGPSGIITYGHRNHNYYPYDTTSTTPHYYLWALDSIHYIYANSIDTADTHTGNGLNNINNKWYPSICYSTGCDIMPYDRIPGYNNIETNFGESFTTGKDYGGPAFLGNTRSGYLFRFSTALEKAFAEITYNGLYKIGIAEAISKSLFATYYSNYTHHIAMIHNLLGDPEFEIWTDIPQQFSDISISRNNTFTNISGISADSTIIAFYNNRGETRIITTDSLNITVNANPNSTIMLYKHNYIPYIAPLVLQKVSLSRSQYVIASDVVAGTSVDSGRNSGDVTVKEGVEYEIEASGTVTLQDGFKVEKGATFAVYPSCF